MPPASRLSVNTVIRGVLSAPAGLPAALDWKACSGNVTLASQDSGITAKSVSGEVNENISGSGPGSHIRARSISGDVKVSDMDGELQAESVSGTVKVIKSRLSQAQLSSTSGNVDFAGDLKGGAHFQQHQWQSVAPACPRAPMRALMSPASVATLTTVSSPKAQRTSEYGPGVELHFVNGGGDAQVNARTLSGNITLRIL